MRVEISFRRLAVKSLSRYVESLVLAAKGSSTRHLMMLCAILVGMSCYTFGQEATIVGTVTDPSGSVIANVSITVTHTDTGQTRSIKTNESGQYVVPDLNIGHYSVKAETAGFKSEEQKGIVLNVGDRARVDFAMKVGSTQESITVEAEAVKVQSDSGELSNVITGQQLSQLATNGRSMYSLISLTPGASSGQGDFQTPTPVGGDANVSFNGERESHNLYLLDGSESSDRGGAGGSDVMPSLDALAEFRTLTSNYSAEYGLSSAATMTAVIKSGTRQFHASAWEFTRNDALDARNYFNPAPNKVAELRFHTYGFNVGGQVPMWKSHPTFFFYNMEWRNLIQGGLTNQTVPLASEYPDASTGDATFASAITVPTTAQVDPSVLFANCPGGAAPAGITQGSAFPGGVIPSCMVDSNSAALLKAGIFPAPTSGTAVRRRQQCADQCSRRNHPHRPSLHRQVLDLRTLGGRVDRADLRNLHVERRQRSDGQQHLRQPLLQRRRSTPSIRISPTLLNEVAFNYNGNRINIIPYGASWRDPPASPSRGCSRQTT